MKNIALVLSIIAIVSLLACANQYGVYLETPDQFYDWTKEHPGVSWVDLDKRSPLARDYDNGGGPFNDVLEGLIEDGRIRVEGRTNPHSGNYFVAD